MENKLQFITLNNSIVFKLGNVSRTVVKGSKEYTEVCAALADGRFSDIPNIVDKETELRKSLNGEFEIINGAVYCEGEPVDPYISSKLVSFYDQGLPYLPLFNFWKRLRLNPSQNSVSQLYRFLEAAKCPITEDGMIVTLKGVQPVTNEKDTYQSIHDSRYKYVLNQYAVMDRKDVVDDPNHACGPGLHAGSYSYAQNWASSYGVVLELLIDPVDVVSVPHDHSSQKLRACRMLPVAVHTGKDFSGGLAIEAQPEPRNVQVSEATSEYVMYGKGYNVYEIDLNTYSNITDTVIDTAVKTKGLMRYRASKAPAAIRRHAADDTVDHAMLLNEAYVFTISEDLNSDTIFVSRCTINSTQKHFMFISEADTHNAERVLKYCANIKEVPKVVNEFYNPEYVSVGLVTYCKEQYEVVEINSPHTVNEFIGMHTDEVVISATKIKPSKAPTNLKNLFSGGIKQIVRVTLSNYSVVFVLEVDGLETLLMRTE